MKTIRIESTNGPHVQLDANDDYITSQWGLLKNEDTAGLHPVLAAYINAAHLDTDDGPDENTQYYAGRVKASCDGEGLEIEITTECPVHEYENEDAYTTRQIRIA